MPFRPTRNCTRCRSKSSRKLPSGFESFVSMWDILTLEDNDPLFFHTGFQMERHLFQSAEWSSPALLTPTRRRKMEQWHLHNQYSVLTAFSLFAFHIHLPIFCYAPFLHIHQPIPAYNHTAKHSIIAEKNILHLGAKVSTSKTQLREGQLKDKIN